MPRIAAYVRVSTLEQAKGQQSQEHAITQYLNGHGLAVEWYRDKVSGETTRRPAFERLQRDIFNGQIDMVVVWKLDRISRTLRDGINVLCDWLSKDVRIVCVSQQLELNTTTGQMVATLLFGLAQMERESLRENTRRGLAAAKARGVKLGRRAKLHADDIRAMQATGQSLSDIARQLNVSRQALYSALRRG